VTTAPVADQRRLLDLQALDTRAAKLSHQRRSLPVLETIAELEGRLEDVRRAQVEERTTLGDVRRELTKAEADVEQVRQRAARHQTRLDSGAVTAKDAQALQSELEQLAKRQGDLEEVELEVMERLEESESRLAELGEQEAAIAADIARHTETRDAEWSTIDGELSTIASERAELVGKLDAGLVKLYDRVRERTGGLAAIALYGSRTEGTQLDFSLTELDAIHSAPADQVVQHEDYGYIIVRMDPK